LIASGLSKTPESAPMSFSILEQRDGLDPIELTSNIGTWVAAGIAIIALVGVVAPLLALQASMSDKNRAMNAVRDQPQKYISRGFHLTRGLRVFRRIRVPNFSPGYITNEPDTAPLIPPLSASLGRWGLKPRDYLPWNTGWAKLSELIESYEVRDGTSNRPVDLKIPKTGGTLEVVNSRTALVANKHWILILGLLGRYGKRIDKGILQRKGIRLSFEEERASIRNFNLNLMVEEKRHGREEPDFEWVRKTERPRRLKHRPLVSSSTDSESSMSWSDSDSDSDNTAFAVRRSPYGTITLESTPQPTIYGITGKMQQLGRHKGSWSYLTSMSFVPHTTREMFEDGIMEKREDCSLQTLFWLAHGFIPCGRTTEGRQRVISLDAPEPHFDAIGCEVEDVLTWPAYSLQESNNVPLSIGVALQCLGIPEPEILQFRPVDTAAQMKRALNVVGTKEDKDSPSYRMNENLDSRTPLPGITPDGAWLRYYNSQQDYFCLFRRDDFEKTLRLILTLDWDNWGFLIWKDRLWMSILHETTDILNMADICDSAFGRSYRLAAHSLILEWKHDRKFHPRKLTVHLSFDRFLTEYLKTYDLLPLRLSLGIRYLTDEPFRRRTLETCTKLSRIQGYEQEQISNLEDALEKLEARYWVQKVLHKDDEIPYTGPIHTCLLTAHFDHETLSCFGIDYEQPDETGYNVKAYIPPWEESLLLEHTWTRRQLHLTKRLLREGVLEYTYKNQQLKWYRDKRSMIEYDSWRLGSGDVVMTDGKESIWIEERDMVMVALWVANRAAMWIGAQDAKPLLDFVKNLDTYLYVL
ncbi:hypothetical protein RAB80_014601, partial [Fusarium oxysporum f. sp. vasinfectum]